MKRSIYLVQPSYRAMDGAIIKGLPIFNYAINMPILSACIPDTWQKRTCVEYFSDIDYYPSEDIILMSSPGYAISHAVDIAKHYKSIGKTIIFGSHTDELSDQLMRGICDVVYYGYPNPKDIAALLESIALGMNLTEYRWSFGVDFAFDYSVYRGSELPFVPIMASTGCKNDCSYCCYPPVFGGRYRLRHIERVVDDLRSVQQFGKPVSFLDGNLFNNREYLLRLCRAITEAKLSVQWGGQATIDIGDDPEVLEALRKANCKLLLFGLETLEPKNEMQLRKEQYPVVQFEDQVKRIQAAGIKAGTYFIFGLDYDTPEIFDRVLKFIDRTNVAVPYLHVLIPIPGTEIYHQLKNENRLLAENFEEYLEKNPEFSVPCSIAYYTPKLMSREEVEERFLELNKKVYSIPRILRRTLHGNVRVSFGLLKLNLEARKKYQAMQRSYDRRAAQPQPQSRVELQPA